MKTIPFSSQADAKSGILREEAVAWVDGLGSGLPGGFDDVVDHQVALLRRETVL